MRTVLKNLVDGLSEEWIRIGKYGRVPSQSSITEARQRIGCRVMSRLFHLIVKPKVRQSKPGVDFEDGSYVSWIAPDGKSKKKGGTKIILRVIEYTIVPDGEAQIYRLITSLMDISLLPTLLLATEYHRRWEVENTIDELKIHLLGRKTLIGSLNPREVVQEIYGWLLGHWAVRSLMFQAAESTHISPLRLSFIGTINVIRRPVPKFQRLQAE